MNSYDIIIYVQDKIWIFIHNHMLQFIYRWITVFTSKTPGIINEDNRFAI